MPTDLFAVAVDGPDATYPMPNKETAETVAERVNTEAHEADANGQVVLLWNARVVPWTYGPELHAKGVADVEATGRVYSLSAHMNASEF